MSASPISASARPASSPYGQRRALELATTLALEPELLLLDEPTAGMGREDVGRTAMLIRRVAQQRTVLMVEHNLSVVADLSDKITVLARGEVLAEGSYAEVAGSEAARARLYGTRAWLTARRSQIDGLHGFYGESARPAWRCRSPSKARRGGDHHRPQRCRQDHHHARDHGAARAPQRIDQGQGRRRRLRRRRRRSRGSASAMCRKSAASMRASTSRTICCCRRKLADGGMSLDRDLSPFPEPARTAPEPGHAALRRRTADARDRARAAHRRRSLPARRADGRPGSSHRRSRSALSSRA